MARTRQGAEFEIEVAGEPYVWRLHRRPHWSRNEKERHGMGIAVRHREGQREAILDFPPGPQPKASAPQLQPAQIPTDLVARAIASAIAAGWEPLSRGKTVTIVVDAAGG
jgi:hypothetical protein